MCSILGILELKQDSEDLRQRALRLSGLQRHRGPDWSGIYCGERAILAHERLSIVGVENGAQPLYGADGAHVLAVNGEIYNHRELAEELEEPYDFKTASDCEIILALYQEQGAEFLDRLKGMFAFVLYDEERDAYLVARDHMGIIPLYTGRDPQGNRYFASEMKALNEVCRDVATFPPGHYLYTEEGDEPTQYWTRSWRSYDNVKDNPADPQVVRKALEKSVHSHLMSDVPYGVLVSGGLDSSIVAAVAARYVERRIEDDDQSPAWWPRLHSFSIGLEGSPDLAAAREVAEHIDTVHHEFTYTVQEGIDALRDVIYHIETYDVTSIRASTPMYLMARMIKAMGIKMVLSGEGADEIFAGYLYFHKAPNARELHEETVRKLDSLHLYDCLRANKSMAAWGVEARVPFLDKEFLDVAMSINPEAKLPKKGGIEKKILRDGFADLLPKSIIERQKEQFSDGVGYSWIDTLKEHAREEVSDADLENAEYRFPYNTPTTHEGYFYRTIFEDLFPGEAAAKSVPGGPTVACSTPTAIAWDESFQKMADPSGRAVVVHDDAY